MCNGVQVGVISFGEDCAAEDVPTIYASIPYFTPWIRIITGIRVSAAHTPFACLLVLVFGVLCSVILN